MADDNLFLIFSESEAPDPLRISLQYFFEKEEHKYKFSTAYLKFTKISNETMITARRFFNIVKETTLVSDELVIRLHTTAGWTYSFEKSFFRKAERSHRRLTRVGTDVILQPSEAAEESKDNPPPQQTLNTPTSLPITQDDSSSIANLSVADTWEKTNIGNITHESSPSANNNTTIDVSLKSDLRSLTNAMNNDIEQALTDLQNSPRPTFTQPLQSDLRHYIDNAIATAFTTNEGSTTMAEISSKLEQIKNLEKEMRTKKEVLNQAEIQYKKASEKMDGRFHFLTSKMDKFENQLQGKLDMVLTQTSQFIDSKKTEIITKMDESMRIFSTKFAIVTSDLEKLSNQINTHSMNVHRLDADTLPTARSLQHVTSQMKELYKIYQKKTTILDGTIDTLHEEIDNVRMDAERTFKIKTNEILQSIRRNVTGQRISSSDTSHQHKAQPTTPSSERFHFSQSSPHKFPSTAFPQSPYQRTPVSSYKGVKTDVLRKMVKLSCNDSDQLLDFYTKLRTAMLQAGIFLREIQDISEDEPIYDEQEGYSESDYRTMSNALYSFLCNEDVIPQDFIFAQNCLKSMSTTMDGFQTLKSMLVLVHPSLNNHRPSNNPPVFSETGDLHLYEQSLRNYFLLHEIYGRSEFSDLDKSKQFIEGLDCDEYENEKTRMMAILDSVELNSLELTSKHTIQSLATTIMNMANQTKTTVQVNTFQNRQHQSYTKRSPGSIVRRPYHNFTDNRSPMEKFPYRPTYTPNRTQKFSQKSTAKQKFTKGQCNACKIYGHHVRDCRFIAPHLAMQSFMKNQPQMCKQILDNHISTNTEEHKRTIIRTMQLTGVLDDEEDSDSYMDMDEIIHTPTVNKINDVVDLTQDDQTQE